MKNKLDMAEVRKKLGITQQVLADMLGVDRKYVSMIETGVKPLSKKLAVKLDRVADIELYKHEQAWTKELDGTVKNLCVKESSNQDIKTQVPEGSSLFLGPCANCARLECEIAFLRNRLAEALARIPKPKDF